MDNVSIIKAVPLIAFVALLVLQIAFPKRQLKAPSGGDSGQRQLHNLLLFGVNAVLMRVLVPLTLISVAVSASQNDWGLFNALPLPSWLIVIFSVILLDFAIYWQHVATHKIPLLWRIHKVHHADHEMDVTTAIRFHPFELVLSLIYKSLVVLLLGAPVLAIIIFELLLFIGPAFNHGNLRLPARLDSVLRLLIASPGIHRAHHSTKIHEQNTNYGFFLIWWDKLFSTYTAEPEGGHLNMQIGVSPAKDQCRRIDQLLLAPFR